MNTQTHVLLALALFGGSVTGRLEAVCRQDGVRATPGLNSSNESLNTRFAWLAITTIVLGALLPDMSLFVMFGYGQMTGVPNELIWSEMYYSDYWQTLGAMTNSAPLFATAALLAWTALRPRPGFSATPATLANGDVATPRTVGSSLNPGPRFLALVYLAALSALVHVAADLPLHHDDGHPHFWPFTQWIFASPVSYWDTRHYAGYWIPIEICFGLALVTLLWKRTQRRWIRGLLLLAAASYLAIATFFIAQWFR